MLFNLCKPQFTNLSTPARVKLQHFFFFFNYRVSTILDVRGCYCWVGKTTTKEGRKETDEFMLYMRRGWLELKWSSYRGTEAKGKEHEMQRLLLIREEVRENSRDFSEDLRAVLHGGRREGQVTEANLYSRPQPVHTPNAHTLFNPFSSTRYVLLCCCAHFRDRTTCPHTHPASKNYKIHTHRLWSGRLSLKTKLLQWTHTICTRRCPTREVHKLTKTY